MNTLIKKFGKSGFNAADSNLRRMFIRCQLRFTSDLDFNSFGAKKVVFSNKASAGDNKVVNVSSKLTSGKKKIEETEEEEVEKEVGKSSKKAREVKKKSTKSRTNKKKSEDEGAAEEETKNEKSYNLKKVNKIKITTPHTLQTVPKVDSQFKSDQKDENSKKENSKKDESTIKDSYSNHKDQQAKKRLPPRKKVDPLIELVDVPLEKLGRVPQNTPLDGKKYTSNPNGIYEDYISAKASEKTKEIINLEREYLCNNYAPLPVICEKGKGVYLQDTDGKIYIDFLSAYSAVNHGHGNHNIINSANAQMNKLHMTSRAFYNNVLAQAAQVVCKVFEFEKVLFMNSGVEAGESAVKIARRWGYVKKKIPDDQAKIVFAKGNFWGRSLYACATSDDPSRYEKFGPFDKSTHYLVTFGDIEEIKTLLENDKNICAVFLEPIQGEGGVVIPPPGYLLEVSKVCKDHNVLLVLDEIQTGIGRTGYRLCCDMDNIKPDIVLLGKSLSGGLYPVSAVLSSKKIMDTIKPGEHGSTYGGNPLAAKICISALQEILSQPLVKNSYYRGIELGLILKEELEHNKLVKEVRGRGLMFAIELWPDCGYSAYDFSLWLMERGLLCKPTKEFTLRLSPPLCITPEEITKSADIIVNVLNQAEKLLPDYKSSVKAKFNIPSSGSDFENHFIVARREQKLRLAAKLAETSNTSTIPDKQIISNPSSSQLPDPFHQITNLSQNPDSTNTPDEITVENSKNTLI